MAMRLDWLIVESYPLLVAAQPLCWWCVQQVRSRPLTSLWLSISKSSTSTILGCTTGEIRLVGGSTNREGRVEVCVNGHWGTVCNKSQEQISGAVCSRLGHPAIGI